MRSDTIARFSLTLLFTYLFSFGATFNGVLIPELKFFTLGLLVLIAAVWGWAHWRGGWTWHTTPLDLTLILWGAALGLSLVANTDAWRRIVMGLWYVGLYAAIWYGVADFINNKRLNRGVIIEAMLFGGLIVVFFGYFQIFSSEFNIIRMEFPRPGSVVGNPNSLGAFLVVIGSLAIGRAALTRSTLARIILGLYGMAILLLIFATFSRGAWIGTAAALGMLVILPLYVRDQLSPAGIKRQWQALGGRTRTVMLGLGVLGLIAALVAGFFIVRSFGQSGRSLSLRAGIYGDAITFFTEQPLTGNGLFTFGREFMRTESQPPFQPHAHAHNGILQVAAELGIVGLAALILSIALVLRAINRNLRAATERERALLIPATAGLIGFGVHHLLDFPAMMPLIALCGLLLLLITTLPLQPQAMQVQWRRQGHPVGMAVLVIALLASGWWSASIYARYNAILVEPFGEEGTGDYRAAAEAMDAIIAADPAMVIYQRSQGYLYGIAALEGDDTAFQPAIDAYQAATDLEPYDAILWTNLAHLHAQSGDLESAIQAMEQAIIYAPDSRQLAFMMGTYYEQAGRNDEARALYTRALTDGTYFWAEWEQYPLAESIQQAHTLTNDRALLVQSYLQPPGSVDVVYADPRANSADYVLRAISSLRSGNDRAYDYIADAQSLTNTQQDQAWVALGQALTARATGQPVDQYLFNAGEYLEVDFSEADIVFGINVPYFQFLRYDIPRRFLPGVFFPPTDSALGYLLRNVDNIVLDTE